MRILLADAHADVCWALRTFLREHQGMTVVGEVEHSDALLVEALTLRPDLIILDWELPGRPTGKILDALHQQQGLCKIVVLGHHPELQQAALQAGADAFVCKTAPPQYVLAVLNELGVRQSSSRSHAG
jgi:DNA-binding NarL/FixJ family response regulator